MTPAGSIMLTAYFPLAFFALLMTRSPAFLLFLMLSVFYLIDWFCKWLAPHKLEIKRFPPHRVVCNTPFEIQTEICNHSFLPLYDSIVNENLSPLLIPQDKQQQIFSVHRNETITIRQSFLIRKRGVYELPQTRLDCLFPFRIFKTIRSGSLRQDLICHPQYFRFSELHLPQGHRLSDQSPATVSEKGSSLDFLGCREYRPGDDIRRIHWKASAVRNTPVIKEFQEEKLSSAAIILDNYLFSPQEHFLDQLRKLATLKPLFSNDPETTFEAAVSLTASIADSLAAQNFVIDVFASGSEIHHFRTGRNTMTQEAFLDLLASLESSHDPERFSQLAPSVLQNIAEAGAVFMLLLHTDDKAEKIYRELLKRNAKIRAFLIRTEKQSAVPDWIELIQPEEILNRKRVIL